MEMKNNNNNNNNNSSSIDRVLDAGDLTGGRSFVLTTHSKSLYNYSQSPGWTEEENRVLRDAIILYGVGGWSRLMQLGLLPGGKMPTQLSLQAQRMLGQQSLGGFMQLRVDPDRVRKDNEQLLRLHESQRERLARGESLRPGEQLIPIRVKNGLVINTGENPTRESRLQQAERNRKRYALTESEAERLVDELQLFDLKRKRRLQFAQFLREYVKQRSQMDASIGHAQSETDKEEGRKDGHEDGVHDKESLDSQIVRLGVELENRRKRLKMLNDK